MTDPVEVEHVRSYRQKCPKCGAVVEMNDSCSMCGAPLPSPAIDD